MLYSIIAGLNRFNLWLTMTDRTIESVALKSLIGIEKFVNHGDPVLASP